MASEPRTDVQIRSEIDSEREQLVHALGDLRAGIRAKRRLAAAAGTLAASGVAVAASLKIARRLRNG